MSRRALFLWALGAALGLLLVPELLPAGVGSGFDGAGLGESLDAGRFGLAAGVVFLGGLLTALTPCVYPLIPITVGVFGARQGTSRGRALLLTSAYITGMGVVFSALGLAAALSGKAFGSTLGNAWLALVLAAFLTVLAASMFGAFELALPSSVATRLHSVGGAGVVGALLMGSVAGLLAAPCTGPVLASLLAWVSRTQDPVLGAALLFVYALGIGVPFFVLGVFTVRLPKGGVWMEWVKSVFGIALLALAFASLRDASPALRSVLKAAAAWLGSPGLLAGVGALAFVGVLLGAVHRSFAVRRHWIPKGLGVALLVVAVILRGSAPGPAAVDERAAVAEVPGGGATAGAARLRWALTFDPSASQSLAPFERALDEARHACRPVMVDFFAEWCAACKELDTHTYTAKDVVRALEGFVSIKVDGTTDSDALVALYERYGVRGLPTVLFIDGAGNILETPRIAGFAPPGPFLEALRRVPSSGDVACKQPS